ncbi:N-acetylmuramoyl-L-alanine amidase [Bacillus sp. BRMEA1]|uniref:N-acetylmuramoyl-L-alanine amidase n=1 Tax=Neobacillus endophyticus TaxID=2738405 RepID=UPI00156516EA|nr:N-acetylmuramoyl-L-alanine amidase [Neobacillus endophyticus]NRD76841.1 N-acetylmuramoyl-L-alanine amidase [Neobacillus endophyticus]
MKSLSLMKILATLGIVVFSLSGIKLNAYATAKFTVTADVLNVREAADSTSKIIGQVHHGDTFDIIQTKNQWDEIKLANNQIGWINNTYLAPKESIPATVEADVLRVREKPSLTGKIIGKLKLGSNITIYDEQNGWAKMVASSGQEGWVFENYLSKQPVAKAKTGERTASSQKKTVGKTTAVNQNTASGDTTTTDNQNAATEKTSTADNQNAETGKIPTADNQNPATGDTSAASQNAETGDTDSNSNNTATGGNASDNQNTASGDTTSANTSKDSSSPDMDRSAAPDIPNSQGPLKGKTIVLDPGHGGKDDGATSITGTHEKALTLATAKRVEQKLENAGANVIMTRTNDTYIPLNQRANLSNQNDADAFISFHYNWTDKPSINGLTDYYYKAARDSRLASDLLKAVAKTTGLNNDGTSFDNLEVLRNNAQPCTLIELGFLSNKQDDSVVESNDYPNTVAQGVYQGLLDYFSNTN